MENIFPTDKKSLHTVMLGGQELWWRSNPTSGVRMCCLLPAGVAAALCAWACCKLVSWQMLGFARNYWVSVLV